MKNSIVKAKKRKINKEIEGQVLLVEQSILSIIELQNREKAIKREIASLKKSVNKYMEDTEKDFIEVPYDENHNVKALRYEQNKVIYNDEVLALLKSKDLLREGCKIVVDEKKMEVLYNAGKLEAAEVAKHAELKNTKVFKVSLIKI